MGQGVKDYYWWVAIPEQSAGQTMRLSEVFDVCCGVGAVSWFFQYFGLGAVVEIFCVFIVQSRFNTLSSSKNTKHKKHNHLFSRSKNLKMVEPLQLFQNRHKKGNCISTNLIAPSFLTRKKLYPRRHLFLSYQKGHLIFRSQETILWHLQ